MPTQSAPAQLDQGSLALATSFVEALIAGNAVPNRTTFDATALAGLSVVHVEPGRLVAEMPVRARVQNRYGTLHGGCTATLVDTLTTAALLTVSPLPGVSMVLSVNYVAPMPGTPVPAASLPVPAPSGAATPADDSASVTLSTTPMPALTGTPVARACPAAGPSSSSSGDGGGSGCGGGSGGCEEAGNEEVVVVDARVVKAGRQVATLAAELRRKRTGQLVATGSHTKFLQIQDSAMDRLKQLSGAEKLQAAGGQAQPRSRL